MHIHQSQTRSTCNLIFVFEKLIMILVRIVLVCLDTYLILQFLIRKKQAKTYSNHTGEIQMGGSENIGILIKSESTKNFKSVPSKRARVLVQQFLLS